MNTTVRSDLQWWPKKKISFSSLNTREATNELDPGELSQISNFKFDDLGSLKKINGNALLAASTLTESTNQPSEANMVDVYWDAENVVQQTPLLKAATIGLKFQDSFFSGLSGTVSSATLQLKTVNANSFTGTAYLATAAFTESSAAPPTYSTTTSVAISGSGVDSLQSFTIPTSWITSLIANNYGILIVASGSPTGAFYSSSTAYGFLAGIFLYVLETSLTIGNDDNIGSMSVVRTNMAGITGTTYGFFAGGTGPSNVIDYVTRASISQDATDSGDLTVARYGAAGVSGATYGFTCDGIITGGVTNSNVIDYITLANATGNATDTGDLAAARGACGGLSGSTYGFICGGATIASGHVSTIEYITLASTSQNASNTGALTIARSYSAGVYGSTYGFVCGGLSGLGNWNVIDYITLATQVQNAIDTGDLTVARYGCGGVSGATYGYICGGLGTGSVNAIDYITLATQTQNATDRGDTVADTYHAGVS